jgi:hypothetical protein
MADFKLRASPRLRFHSALSIDGVIGVGGLNQLAGSATARAIGQAALLKGVNLAGSAAASSQAVAALLKGIRLQGTAVAGATTAASLGWSVAPVITFLGGTGGTFNVAATGPAGYSAGGVYGVDPLNTALPSLITLSESGLLSDSGSAVTSSNAIRFTYHEQGALPTLTLHPTSTATLPYHATVYLCEGVVPSGQILVSPNDANLRGSVLSSYADGSAQVMVVAGETAVTNGVTKAINLRPGAPSGTALTAARIDAIVSSIVVNFGGGDQTLSDFTLPLRTWWANPATICCRYVLGCGLGTMKAIIDIHAFKAGVSDRAFVEVVIENGEVDADLGTVTGPSTQTYTNATVKVNGATIATVSSPTASMVAPNSIKNGVYLGGHEMFRAWYCSTWVGLDPGMDVTHDTAYLQAHPWFWKQGIANNENMATKYAQSYDTYVPWATCRLRTPGMDAGGGDQEIGPLTTTNSDYIITGSKFAARASIATALGRHSVVFGWRHDDGVVPTPAQAAGKNTSLGTWPATPGNNDVQPRWGADGSHVPASTLVPFLCRPSPCFIELAQKEAIWHHTNFSSTDGSHRYDQLRARAWRIRNYAMAAYLTPDVDATTKAAWRNVVRLESLRVKTMLDQPWNTLDALWEYHPDPTGSGSWNDQSGSRPNYQGSFFQHIYVASMYHAVDRAKVLVGADATDFATLADRTCAFLTRWVTDAVSYEWRALPYQPTIGVLQPDYLSLNMATLGANAPAITRAEMSGTVPNAPGPWKYLGPGDFNYDTLGSELDGPAGYSGLFFYALCAAVERDSEGAAEAWTAIYGTSGNGGITNFAAWYDGYASYSLYNRWPRNR